MLQSRDKAMAAVARPSQCNRSEAEPARDIGPAKSDLSNQSSVAPGLRDARASARRVGSGSR